MKIRKALIGFALVTILYLSALIWLDMRGEIFSGILSFSSILPVLVGLSLASWTLRFIRWHWLLRRAGFDTPRLRSMLAYIAGFAFTATPGKLGELIRINYFTPMGVPPTRVLAAFILERFFDLVVVLCLATLSFSRLDLLIYSVGFVFLVGLSITILASNAEFMMTTGRRLERWRAGWLSRLVLHLNEGIQHCRIWMNPKDLAVCIVLGTISWLITSTSFLLLLKSLGIILPLSNGLAIYPLAMLTGAASMLPGGLGSTEAAIVLLLTSFDIDVPRAALAAVGIRLGTMWLAILCGFLAILALTRWRHVASPCPEEQRPGLVQ